MLDKGFKFQPKMSMSMKRYCYFINNVGYRCIVTGICKSEAVKVLQNIGLTEKSGALFISTAIWSYKFTRNSSCFFLKKGKL